MKDSITIKDLEGALLLISFDTVDIEDADEVEHITLPYTIEDGKLNCYSFDQDGVTIDRCFNPKDYDICRVYTTNINLDTFVDGDELLDAIIEKEGKEILEEGPANEWSLLDNKVTLVAYDATRNKLAERVWIGTPSPKEEEKEEVELTPEQTLHALDVAIKIRESEFRSDRRTLLLHIAVMLVAGALAAVGCWLEGALPEGICILSVVTGLYATQIWWCNAKRSPLGSGAFCEIKRRVEGRPWINGGLISGVVMGIVAYIFNDMNFAVALFVTLLAAFTVTFAWWALKEGMEPIVVNDSFGDSVLNGITKSNRKMARKGIRQFYIKLFKRMLWLD